MGLEFMDWTALEFEGYVYYTEIGSDKVCNSYMFRVAGVDLLLKSYVTPQHETVDFVGLGEQDVGCKGLKCGRLPSTYITRAWRIRRYTAEEGAKDRSKLIGTTDTTGRSAPPHTYRNVMS